MQVLVMLLERRGDIVTREELQEKLWPDVNVDAERGLNAAITRLRGTLGDSAENPRFVQTLPRKGYRFLVPAEIIAAPAPVVVSPPATSEVKTDSPTATEQLGPVIQTLPPLWNEAEDQQRRERRLRAWQWAGWTASVVAAVVLGWIIWRYIHQPPLTRIMLAVLPFANLSGDVNDKYFSDGMTEETITQLGLLNPERLGVIARTSVEAVTKSGRPLDQIARDLRVQYVLEGSVRRSGDIVKITTKLIRASDQSQLWSDSYEQPLSDILKVQDAVGRAVAGQISISLLPRKPPRPVNVEAYVACLRARHLWMRRSEEDLKKAVEYLQIAVKKDSNYALAHAWLADAYNLVGYYSILPPATAFPLAKAEAEKAVALDDTLAEAHASLANVAYYQWNWSLAEKEFLRAITLNPNYAAAREWYAAFLSVQGRPDEAVTEIEKALSLEPVSVAIRTDMAVQAYSARRYNQALAHIQQALDLDKNYPQAYLWLGLTHLAQEHYAPAIEAFQKSIELSGGNPIYVAFLGAAYGKAGRRDDALKVLSQLENMAKRRRVAPEAFALIYIGLGDHDRVFFWAEKTYEQRSGILARLKVEPILDPVRSDPRFANLMQRVGLQ